MSPEVSFVKSMVPSLALLVDGGISKSWDLIEGVSSLKTHLWRAMWALGASLFLSALNSNHVPCHDVPPCHRLKVAGPKTSD